MQTDNVTSARVYHPNRLKVLSRQSQLKALCQQNVGPRVEVIILPPPKSNVMYS